MAAYIWPTSLPNSPGTDYTETGGVRVLRTSTDAGVPKMRYIGRNSQTISVSYVMTNEQVATLKEFVEETIMGVSPFEFTHPRTKETVNVRIVPSGDGEFFTMSWMAKEYWSVSMKMEAMP